MTEPSREARLAQKQAELQRELEEWARNEGLLGANEQVFLVTGIQELFSPWSEQDQRNFERLMALYHHPVFQIRWVGRFHAELVNARASAREVATAIAIADREGKPLPPSADIEPAQYERQRQEFLAKWAEFISEPDPSTNRTKNAILRAGVQTLPDLLWVLEYQHRVKGVGEQGWEILHDFADFAGIQ